MSTQFMVYGGLRLKECMNLTANMAEVPDDHSEKHHIKLIQTSVDMLRITLLW